jgi:hypothetical protein
MPVRGLEDVRSIMAAGKKQRAVSATKANAASSRSHCLLLVAVKTTDHSTRITTGGRLILVRCPALPPHWAFLASSCMLAPPTTVPHPTHPTRLPPPLAVRPGGQRAAVPDGGGGGGAEGGAEHQPLALVAG